jgi:hypothetical protein
MIFGGIVVLLFFAALAAIIFVFVALQRKEKRDRNV